MTLDRRRTLVGMLVAVFASLGGCVDSEPTAPKTPPPADPNDEFRSSLVLPEVEGLDVGYPRFL
jgi:hypothetical protein